MGAVRTTCPYCGVGCGISASVTGERALAVSGDKAHPANAGRLCSKGTHLGETVGLEGRLLHPEIGGERVEWDEALDLVAARFRDTVREHGPDSVAFYVSGQLLTEDYYVANKLMKGFIGSANIDTNSRLCMASAVAAHIRAFGEDVVPCSYSDLEEAELILLVGSNTAWCHPVIWQRIEKARAENGCKLVVVDPRRTETAAMADLHIPIAPNGDTALFNALLLALREREQIDAQFLASHVETPADFWDTLPGDVPCAGVAPELFGVLVELVENSPKMVTMFSQGVNQSTGGTDKANAIINLHLATGRIGKPGAGPFSITGQPNAMGGREVGGLASMLAVHMGFSPAECAAVQDFWKSPAIATTPGKKAVDMFRAVHDGRIKALWIMATNPAVSMPEAGFVREALERCEFLVVSDVMRNTDSGVHADVRLPALAWAEKDGTVTNSERVISRQRKLFDAPGEARADWDIVSAVARRMGHGNGFAYRDAATIFREYAAMTAVANEGRRCLDLSRFAHLTDRQYDAMEPFQWGGASPLADGSFYHADRRARLVSVKPTPAPAVDSAFPLRLNSGRYRDQWHTMTRTGLSPRLTMHRREPLLDIHPADAASRALGDGDLARVTTSQGNSVFRVHVTEDQSPGTVFAPMHWTDRTSSGGRLNRLPDQSVDPHSGQPGFKDSAAEVAKIMPDWRAFLVSRDRPELPQLLYWTVSRVESGWLSELSGEGMAELDLLLPDGERLEATDMRRGMRRIVVRDGEGKLAGALFITRNGELPERSWIVSQLANHDDEVDGVQLLAGRPRLPAADKGPMVCVCFGIGTLEILRTVSEQRLTTVEQVGAALSAGTNCGSCRPQIAQLLAQPVEDDMMEAAE